MLEVIVPVGARKGRRGAAFHFIRRFGIVEIGDERCEVFQSPGGKSACGVCACRLLLAALLTAGGVDIDQVAHLSRTERGKAAGLGDGGLKRELRCKEFGHVFGTGRRTCLVVVNDDAPVSNFVDAVGARCELES